MNRLHLKIRAVPYVIAGVVLSVVTVGTRALAWPTDVCATSEPQYEPMIAPTGGGGAFVVYPAVVSGVGSVRGALLTENGSPISPVLCGEVLLAEFAIPRVCPDGAGGFIIAVMRNGDIYAQRREASGNLMWGSGVPVCTASGAQTFADRTFGAVAPDGSGGCYVTWRDLRDGGTSHDIYVQHLVGADGSVAPGSWGPNGKQLTGGSGNETEPVVVSDGVGGAIVVWQDDPIPFGSKMRVKASRVDTNGFLHTGWAVGGDSVSSAASSQATPTLIPDGASGAFVVWESGSDIFAGHLLGNATIDSNWPTIGIPLTQANMEQSAPEVIGDGNGGGIVTWTDKRDTTADIYAQRFDGAGTVLWTTNGVAIAVAPRDQSFPRLVSDDAGGAIICWDDGRNSVGDPNVAGDVYAQRIGQGGSILWDLNGVRVAGGLRDQRNPVIASDGSAGAVIAWRDFSVDEVGGDVLAGRVLVSGAVVGVTGARGGEEFQRVRLVPNPAREFVGMSVAEFAEESCEFTVHDLSGRRIRRFETGPNAAARIKWDLRDDSGKRVAAGLYWVRARAGVHSLRRALVVIQ